MSDENKPVEASSSNDENLDLYADKPDASGKEVVLYAFGNVENAIANQFFNILQTVMVVAMMVNPLLIGLMVAIKSMWDSVTDPVMAHVTDNANTRWGRRRPFILVGGVGRIAFLLLVVIFFPQVEGMLNNSVLEGDKQSSEIHQKTKAQLLKYEKDIEAAMSHPEQLSSWIEPEGEDLLAHRENLKELQTIHRELMPAMLTLYQEREAAVSTHVARAERLEAAASTVDAAGEQASLEAKKDMENKALKTRGQILKVHQSTHWADQLQLALEELKQVSKLERLELLPVQLERLKSSREHPLMKTLVEAKAEIAKASQEIRTKVALWQKSAEFETSELQAELKKVHEAAVTSWASKGDLQESLREQLSSLEATVSVQESKAFSHEDQWEDMSKNGERETRRQQIEELKAMLSFMEQLPQRWEGHQVAIAALDQKPENKKAQAAVRQQVDEALMAYTTMAKVKKAKGNIQKIKEGWAAFWDPSQEHIRWLFVYVTAAFLIFTTLSTVQSVPYFALGIELCPSYNGRTKVMTYRSVMDKVAGLAGPWIPVFCFLTMFDNALDGLYWVAVGACIIGIPSTVIMCWFIKEPSRDHQTRSSQNESKGAEPVELSEEELLAKEALAKKSQMSFWVSMIKTVRNPNFIRLFLLYTFVGLCIGTFGVLGNYLNIYWVMGSALSGASMGAYVQTLAWVLSLLSLPVLQWACNRFQKHVVLRVALLLMVFGSALNWWCYQKGHPEYQFILPFFFSLGIGSYFAVLSTMLADVTDHDELLTGKRREGMFGAIMAFLMKMCFSLTPILSGGILVLSGFDPALEYQQTEETILNMRILFSFVPAGMLLVCLLSLIRYPLTRERMEEIKEELKVQRAAQARDA